MQAVPKPTGAYIGHLFHLRHVGGYVAYFIDEMRIHAIEHPRKYLLAALNHDSENRNGNNKTDDWVGQRIAKPHTERTGEHGQAGPAVDPRVVAVGDERGAADPAAYTNSENRNHFIAGKADNRCSDHRPKMRNILRMKQALDAFVAGDDRAEKYRQNNGNARKVFNPAVAEGESFVRLLAREQKCDAQRDRCRSVSKIVNGIRQQADTA